MALWDVLGRSEALELSGALGRSRVFWCVLGRSEMLLGRSGALSGFHAMNLTPERPEMLSGKQPRKRKPTCKRSCVVNANQNVLGERGA